MKILNFTTESEKNGYPFFQLSSFRVWIAYSDGNKRTRYSIETKTTIAQLIAGHKQTLLLDRKQGVDMLITLVNKQSKYINFAKIYYHDGTEIADFNGASWNFKKELKWNGTNQIKSVPFTITNKILTISIK
jgi:hypothetical protein